MTTPVPEPQDDAFVRALRVRDEWWPRVPRPGPFRHTVGVRAADPGTWLRPGPDDHALLPWLHDLMDAAGPRIFQARPGTEAAGAEALAVVAEATGKQPPPDGRHPLDRAARLVVEDLCLVDVTGPDPVLVAASVAMPSRWRLADKLGQNLVDVHGPVPQYAQHIGTATDRLMQRLDQERLMARSTWSITDVPDLFQPAGTSRVEQARPGVRTGADAAQALCVRVEYQTVRALPESGAVLFTIHTCRERLGDLADRPQVAQDLLAWIDFQSPDQRGYKGVAPYLGPIRECLTAMAASAA